MRPKAVRDDQTEPNSSQAQRHARADIQKADYPRSAAQRCQSFPLETGESGVAAKDPRYQKQAPIGMDMGTVQKQCHEQADEERTCDIDRERSYWKRRGVKLCHHGRHDKSRDSAQPAAKHHNDIFAHLLECTRAEILSRYRQRSSAVNKPPFCAQRIGADGNGSRCGTGARDDRLSNLYSRLPICSDEHPLHTSISCE